MSLEYTVIAGKIEEDGEYDGCSRDGREVEAVHLPILPS